MRRRTRETKSQAQKSTIQPPRAPEPLLTLEDIAAIVKKGKSTLNRWRAQGDMPEPIKFSGGAIRWQPHVIEAWIAKQRGYQPPVT